MFENILPDIYLVGSTELTHNGDCQVFFVRTGPGRGVLIDAGADPSAKGIIENLRTLNVRPTHIILTHGHIDHIGGAYALKNYFEAEIIAHERDREVFESYQPVRSAAVFYGIKYSPVEVDRSINEDTVLTVDGMEFHIIEVPGHTPGSIAVYIDHNGKRVLFGQDIHGPFSESWGSDPALHRHSLGKLLNLNADVLCEGHFGVIQPSEKVREYIESYIG